MPQFLRAIRALCNLYPFFKQALQRGEIIGVDSVAHSVPVSPATTDLIDPFQPSSNVRRAGSFGSLVDGNTRHHRSQTAANPVRLTRRGYGAHRRTHSQTLPPTEGNHNGGSPNSSHQPDSASMGSPMMEDPFQKLEIVWASLESWFDLILAEVEKTSSLPGSEVAGRTLLMRRMQSVDGSSATSEGTNQAGNHMPVTNGTVREEEGAVKEF